MREGLSTPRFALRSRRRNYVALGRLSGLITSRETATAARRARLAPNAKPTNAKGGVFAFNAEREAYERQWTAANYAVLTEVLATLPVNWRHYLKKRIFAALQELPAHQRRGDGSEVRRAFDLAVAEFPQLGLTQAAE